MLRIYGDESCTHRGARITALAAYVGRPKEWRTFKKLWRRPLGKGGIKTFHTVDFENCEGEFIDWDEPRKAKLRSAIFPLIPRYTEFGMSCAVINPQAMKAAVGLEIIRKEFRRDELPYLYCFTWLVRALARGLIGKLEHERLAFVFEDNQYSHIAMRCYDWIKENMPYGKRLAGTMTFAPKDEHPGLQAADVLAFETCKCLDNWVFAGTTEQRPGLAILNEKKSVLMLPHPSVESVHMEMRNLALRAREFRQERS